MRGAVNNILEDKKGEREKSILLKFSAVVMDPPPLPAHLYSFIFGVDEAQRVEI